MTTVNNPREPAPANSISVAGHGAVSVPPDRICICLYVAGEGMSTEDAQRTAERKSSELKEALLKAFPNLESVTLSRCSIREKISRMLRSASKEPPRPEVIYMLTITAGMEHESDVRKIIDTALSGGAAFQWLREGESTVYYLLREDKPALEQAAARALENAREKAAALAKLAGKNLGPLISLTEREQFFSRAGTDRMPSSHIPEKYSSEINRPIQVSSSLFVTFELTPL